MILGSSGSSYRAKKERSLDWVVFIWPTIPGGLAGVLVGVVQHSFFSCFSWLVDTPEIPHKLHF